MFPPQTCSLGCTVSYKKYDIQTSDTCLIVHCFRQDKFQIPKRNHLFCPCLERGQNRGDNLFYQVYLGCLCGELENHSNIWGTVLVLLCTVKYCGHFLSLSSLQMDSKDCLIITSLENMKNSPLIVLSIWKHCISTYWPHNLHWPNCQSKMEFAMCLSPEYHYITAVKEKQGGWDSRVTRCSLMSPAPQSKNIDSYLCGLGKAAQSQIKANALPVCLIWRKRRTMGRSHIVPRWPGMPILRARCTSPAAFPAGLWGSC